MRNFTIIQNVLLEPSQISVGARYLLCVLLKYCGQDDNCYPSQKTLGIILGITDRQVRNKLNELLEYNLIYSRRRGWNRSNTYSVAKSFIQDRKGISYHLRSAIPLHQGNFVPTKSTYIKGKGKTNLIGLEKMRNELVKNKIL